MSAGLLHLVIAVLGMSFAIVIYRADRRLDNRLFALLAGGDALVTLYRALEELAGHTLDEIPVMRLCGVGSVVLSYLSMEFAHSFPRNRPAPTWLRLTYGLASLGAIGLMVLGPTTSWFAPRVTYFYFLPGLFVISTLLIRNYRALRGEGGARAGVRMVMIAFGLRWTFAVATFGIAARISPEVFSVSLLLESTLAVLLSYMLMGTAIVRNSLFRVRGVMAEVIIYTTFLLLVLGATGAAVEAALRFTDGAVGKRIALIAASCIPVAAALVGFWMRGPLAEYLLLRMDRRRALRKEVLARVLRTPAAGAAALVAQVQEALVEVTQGGAARFLPPAAVPAGAGTAEYTRDPDGALLVPVRSGDTLHGALVVEGGEIDRDTIVTATALAGQLGLRLENQALFAELEESRRLATLGSFAAAIAHDIRTPLTSVQMNVQILRGKSGALPPDDMEYFDIALAELRRLNAHVSELLDYAKPVRLDASSCDLREVADEAARSLSPLLEEKELSVEREHAAALPAVNADARRLRQVLQNLIDNAARASQPGGSIVVRTRSEGGKVSIEVCDRGKGMAPDDLAHIFEPFFTTRTDGTGLGLAIVQKLVRAHAGEVLVRSAPGHGSTFTVVLPAA
jgi:signal transduction histidine kinase